MSAICDKDRPIADRKERLQTLEHTINAELMRTAEEEGLLVPITDGVVDIDRYLDAPLQMLWILKESWVGSPSVTQYLIPKLISEGRITSSPTYRKMAYVTYAALNGYAPYSEVHSAHRRSAVCESLRSIAYINVNKFRGPSRSEAAAIRSAHSRNRDILQRQVDTIDPHVIITGNILHLFYEDFGLRPDEMTRNDSVNFCWKHGRLYINAYHPSYCFDQAKYVNDLVRVIERHFPTPHS